MAGRFTMGYAVLGIVKLWGTQPGRFSPGVKSNPFIVSNNLGFFW